MKEDTRDALKRFEEELLAESFQEELEAGPAFDDPDEIPEAGEEMIYYNFANDYGRAQSSRQRRGGDWEIKALTVTACGLCLAIIGVLLYWLEVFL